VIQGGAPPCGREPLPAVRHTVASARPRGMIARQADTLMRIRHLLFVPFLALVACSADESPLDGKWKVEPLPAGFDKHSLDLDGASDKVLVHFDVGDEHAHKHGTYTYDAAAKTLTVRCLVLGDGKPDVWTGTVAGDTMTLTGGDTKLTLKKAGKAGH
jgi:hypothetical protein